MDSKPLVGPAPSRRDRARAYWAYLRQPHVTQTILFSLIGCFLNADQNLTAPNLTQIGHDFGFDDYERDFYVGGVVSGGFWLVGGLTAIIVGYLADKYDRRKLFAACVFLGEFSCFMTIAVTTYWGFFATRILTGMSIGGATPLIYSMVGDLWNDEVRGRVVSFVTISTSIGTFLGVQIASQVGPVYGWRVPFAVVAVPSLILAPIFYLCTTDPKRGAAEGILGLDATKEYAEHLDFAKIRRLLSTWTVVILVFQGIPGSMPWGVMNTYFQDFLVQDVGKNGTTITVQTSSIVGTTFGIGCGLGVIIGGYLTDYLWPKDYRYVPWMMGISTTLGALPIYAVVNAPPTGLYVYALIVLPSGFLATFTASSVRTVLLNVTLPETRGSTFALFTLLNDLGQGVAPLFVAALIGPLHRIGAFNIALAGWFICGVLLFSSSFYIRHDMKVLNERLANAKLTSSSIPGTVLESERRQQQQQQLTSTSNTTALHFDEEEVFQA